MNPGVDIIGPPTRAKDARRVLLISNSCSVSVSHLNCTWPYKDAGAVPGCLDLLYAHDFTFPAVGTNPFTRPGGSPQTAPCRYCNLAPTDAQFLHRLMPVAVLLTNMASSVAVSLGWTVYRVYDKGDSHSTNGTRQMDPNSMF